MRLDQLIPLIIIIIFIVRTMSKLLKGAREEEEGKENVEVYRAREEKVEKYFKSLFSGEEPKKEAPVPAPPLVETKELKPSPIRKKEGPLLPRRERISPEVSPKRPTIPFEEELHHLTSLLASTEEVKRGIILSTVLGPPKAKRWMRI